MAVAQSGTFGKFGLKLVGSVPGIDFR